MVTGELLGVCGGGSVGLTTGATLGVGDDFGVAALTGGCVAATGDAVGDEGVVVGKVEGEVAGDCALLRATEEMRQDKTRAQAVQAISVEVKTLVDCVFKYEI